jgi:plasmid maintenance system antidote protein VapI
VRDNLPHLKRQMKRYGVTQDRVAAVAGVHRTMVNKVVNGRAKSRKVVDTITVLISATRQLTHAAS